MKVEEYKERTLRPVVAHFDEVIDYFKEKRDLYDKGLIP